VIAYLLNLFDLACTYLVLCLGGWEVNPLVRWMLETHPALYPFCKVFLAAGLFWWLDRLAKREPATRYALWAVTGVYAAIAVYYIILIFGGAIYG